MASAKALLSAAASGMMALTGIVFAMAIVMVQFSAIAKGVVGEVSLLDSRQHEPTEHSATHIEHRNESGLYCGPIRLLWL